MTFKIGKIELPADPSQSKYRFVKDIKDIKLLMQLPFLLSLGPKVPVLRLKGYLSAPGKTAIQLEGDYLLPLRDMIWAPASYPRKVADDDQASVWGAAEIGSGSLGITLSNDSSIYIKGNNSLKCAIGAGSYQRVGVYVSYTTSPKDFSKQDFASLWLYGANSGDWWWLEFLLPNSSNRYAIYIDDDYTGWKRHILRKDEFDITGSPNWKNCQGIYLTSEKDEDWWLDRFMVGVGQYIDGPGLRYDGLYLVRDFTFEETYKALNAFPYLLELWLEDDYY